MNRTDVIFWAQLVSQAITNAMSSLSMMIGIEVSVNKFGLRQIPIDQISHLMGGPDNPSIGIYLTFSGSADGHIMLMYEPKMGMDFVDLLLCQPPGTATLLTEMERSALGEMGNIVGSSFLNALADSGGMTLKPSPPSVMMDMAGALLDVIAAEIVATQDDAFIAETAFHAPGRDISGAFFVIPSQGLLDGLMARLAA